MQDVYWLLAWASSVCGRQQLTESAQKLIYANRLCESCVNREVRVRVEVCGDNDDFDMGSTPSHPPSELEAVNAARRAKVKEHEVNVRIGYYNRERFLRIVDFDRLKSGNTKLVGKVLPHQTFVFNDQDCVRLPRLGVVE